jgi:excisionase family DNA binding protein
MALRRRLRHEPEPVEKVLEVDASMQGTLSFKDPVNLRINGNFEGNLNTKGTLMVGEHAKVRADIVGEEIIVAGTIEGNITAHKELKLIAPACVMGDIVTPLLTVAEGALLDGRCKMLFKERVGPASARAVMNVEELSRYLEVEQSLIREWAESGKLPAVKEGDAWKFERARVDEWVATEKIK